MQIEGPANVQKTIPMRTRFSIDSVEMDQPEARSRSRNIINSWHPKRIKMANKLSIGLPNPLSTYTARCNISKRMALVNTTRPRVKVR